MNTELKINEEIKQYLIRKRALLDGIQYIFKFQNNYGASVIKNSGSYGHHEDLWEMALIFFDEDGDWEPSYEKDFEFDVIGYLTDERVNSLLEKIMVYNTRSIIDYQSAALDDVHTVLESGLDLVKSWEKEKVVTEFTEPRVTVNLENKEYKPRALYDLLIDYEYFISEDGFASNDEKEWFLKNWLMKLTEDNKQELIDFVKGDKR